MTNAPERIWAWYHEELDDWAWSDEDVKDGYEDFTLIGQFIRADLAKPHVRPDKINVLRKAINTESGGYWLPTDEMLTRILSALEETWTP